MSPPTQYREYTICHPFFRLSVISFARPSSRNLDAVDLLTDTRKSITIQIRCLVAGALAFASVQSGVETARAAIVNGDPLELAIAARNDAVQSKETSFDVFAADEFSYDDNIYSLSPGVTDLQSLNGIGPNATRDDYINTIMLGLDGLWNVGRQTITLDLLTKDNRFDHNTNLDNYSNSDKLIWNWNIGSVLSGEVGAMYDDALISFVNANNYARNVYAVTNYYGAGRYQIGPHWAIYGGVLQSDTTLNNPALRSNDINAKSVELGSEFATSINDTLGLEYRYTDATYPNGTSLNDDYREDAARFVVRHAFSEKTKITANVGFLKRDYATSAIPSFSGDVWRIDAQWLPTDKVQVALDGWRNLQAYVSAQSDYYASTGARIAPQWAPTEKITLTLAVAYESQDYIGVTASELSQGSRRDTLTTSQASITYTAFKFLIFDFGYAYEKRNSNVSTYQFNDNVISAKATVKW